MVRIDHSISVARVDDYMDYCHHRQLKDNWCWAACVEMVLDYYGIMTSQDRIVERTYGDDIDLTANKDDIIDAVDGWVISGDRIHAEYKRYKSAKDLIDSIVKGNPLIIGLDEDGGWEGHACVLTHVFFRNNNGSMYPDKVLIINPANDGDLEESLDWSDFYNRINTIIRITKN